MEHTVIDLLMDDGHVAGVLAYDRERGRFHTFAARAVVLATGGVGRAYRITSNSWEGTGDGHALAYRAGAELIDMEFVQFHPTGMVWPPSVKGILVTEGVRGEGGVLKNSEGRRFMFDDIPENYRPQTASDAEEGWRYTQGDKSARRPPELLTRDHVARCIRREVRAGRGSPHGGVFLDIAWIKEKLPGAADHIRRKLPSMYHQFKELADLDITQEPMEVGPTTHYIMGGIRVDADTQASTIPGLFAAGECAAGINGANRLGGNSLSDLIVFGKRAGEYAAAHARESPRAEAGRGGDRDGDAGRARAVRPRRRRGESLHRCSRTCRTRCRTWSASCGVEAEMLEALTRLEALYARAARAGVEGHREYHTGWHACLDLRNLMAVSEAITRSALERRESRGGHFRDDYPDKVAEYATFNVAVHRDRGRHDARRRGGPFRRCRPNWRGSSRIRNSNGAGNLSTLARRRRPARGVRGLRHRDLRGHGRARCRAPHPGRAGARPGVPLELQGRQVRIVLGRDQRPAEADVHDAAEHARPRGAGDRRADARVSAAEGPGDRRVRRTSASSRASGSSRRDRRMPPTARGAWRSATSTACRSSASASSASCARTCAT